MASGTRLVKCTAAFYQGTKAGSIAEIPTEIADQAIAAGLAVAMDTLDARLGRLPSAAGVVRYGEPPTSPTPHPRAVEVPSPGVIGPMPEPVLLEKPSGKASKEAWFAYAVQNGVSDEDADAATRNELRDRFKD